MGYLQRYVNLSTFISNDLTYLRTAASDTVSFFIFFVLQKLIHIRRSLRRDHSFILWPHNPRCDELRRKRSIASLAMIAFQTSVIDPAFLTSKQSTTSS